MNTKPGQRYSLNSTQSSTRQLMSAEARVLEHAANQLIVDLNSRAGVSSGRKQVSSSSFEHSQSVKVVSPSIHVQASVALCGCPELYCTINGKKTGWRIGVNSTRDRKSGQQQLVMSTHGLPEEIDSQVVKTGNLLLARHTVKTTTLAQQSNALTTAILTTKSLLAKMPRNQVLAHFRRLKDQPSSGYAPTEGTYIAAWDHDKEFKRIIVASLDQIDASLRETFKYISDQTVARLRTVLSSSNRTTASNGMSLDPIIYRNILRQSEPPTFSTDHASSNNLENKSWHIKSSVLGSAIQIDGQLKGRELTISYSGLPPEMVNDFSGVLKVDNKTEAVHAVAYCWDAVQQRLGGFSQQVFEHLYRSWINQPLSSR